jgi:sugar lactone lactonase YvrE
MTEHDAFELRFGAAVRGYAGRISSDLDPVELAHRIAAAEPRRRGFGAALTWRGVAIPRAAWLLLLLAGLFVAVAGTALVASRLLETAPRIPPLGAALVPTGIDVLTAETGGYPLVVADGDGILWAREPGGRLVRFDPASGSARAWTVGDDAGFGVTTSSGFDILPAGEGGVWLVGRRTLRLFDGEGFRQVIDAPRDIGLAVEAPDGSLWATTEPCCIGPDGAVMHWDGSSWSSLALGGLNADATVGALAVDAAGRPWIGWVRDVAPPPGPGSPVYAGSVSRYDGSSWTTFDSEDAAALGGGVFTVRQLPDGDVWVASAAGLARFDGSSWTDAGGPWGTWGASVAAAQDGAIWVAAFGSDEAIGVARFDGRSWVSYGHSDGLPGPNESTYVVAHALPTKDGVFVGTGAGIYRLAGDRWERAWPRGPSPLMDLRSVLAISRDELWATDIYRGGLAHFRAGVWTRESIDPDIPAGQVNALALAPDGSLWAAGPDGVAYRRDGQWVIVDAAQASVIAVGQDQSVWVGGASGEECRLSELTVDGAEWVRRAVACPPDSSGLSSLAVDANGALWAAWTGMVACEGGGWGGCPTAGLARLHGQRWEAIREIGGFELTNPTIVGTTQTGDMWVVDDPTELRDPAEPERPVTAARFDGTDWTVVELPEGFMADVVVAPDGTLWAWAYWTPASTGGNRGADRGPARYDGTAWTLPYDGAGLPWMELAAVAPDGTVFGRLGFDVFRFPDQTVPP